MIYEVVADLAKVVIIPQPTAAATEAKKNTTDKNSD